MASFLPPPHDHSSGIEALHFGRRSRFLSVGREQASVWTTADAGAHAVARPDAEVRTGTDCFKNVFALPAKFVEPTSPRMEDAF